MSNATVQTPTADCRHCLKPVRQNSKGIWGARKRDDNHPWYCDGNPDAGKRHEPKGTAAAELRTGDMLRMGVSENYVLLCAVELTGDGDGEVRVTAHGYGLSCNSWTIPGGERVRTGLRNVTVPDHEEA